jgi:hypothetical protein
MKGEYLLEDYTQYQTGDIESRNKDKIRERMYGLIKLITDDPVGREKIIEKMYELRMKRNSINYLN